MQQRHIQYLSNLKFLPVAGELELDHNLGFFQSKPLCDDMKFQVGMGELHL